MNLKRPSMFGNLLIKKYSSKGIKSNNSSNLYNNNKKINHDIVSYTFLLFIFINCLIIALLYNLMETP